MVEPPNNQEIFQVVINLEDQYSIWSMSKTFLMNGVRQGNLELKKNVSPDIKEGSNDMRPRSLK